LDDKNRGNSGKTVLLSPIALAGGLAWPAAPFALHGRMHGILFLIEKRLLSPIAVLRDMMGDTRNHSSRQSCYGASLPAGPRKVNANSRG
jgi:hypothetical protein